MLSASHQFFNKAADVLKLSDPIRDILLSPVRSVKVEIVVEDDKTSTRTTRPPSRI